MSNARQLAASATSLTDLSDNSISGAFDVGSLTIGGTEVIDSSRNLSNIAGGFRTVNGTSVVGSGDISAGASTTFGDVGTYTVMFPSTGSFIDVNTTRAGSAMRRSQNSNERSDCDLGVVTTAYTMSGTWRSMSRGNGAGYYAPIIWVRIS